MVDWQNSPSTATPITAANLAAAFAEPVADARLPVTAQAATLSATYAATGPKPTAMLAAGSVGPYDTRICAYNVTPTSTARLRWVFANAMSRTLVVRVAFLGDSTTSGSFTEPSTQAWPVVLLRMMESMGYPVAGTGPVVGNPSGVNPATPDGRWAFTGTWTSQGGVASPNFIRTTTTSGATATFTSDRPGTVLEFAHFPTGAAFTYSIDGGAPVTITPPGGTWVVVEQFTGLANTTHTLKLTTTTTSNFNLVWANVRNATYGLQFANFAAGGSKTADANNLTYYYPGQMCLAWNPHVTFIAYGGINENGSVPVATWKASTQALITAQAQGGNTAIVLVNAHPIQTDNLAQYRQAFYELADSNDLPLIDMFTRWRGTYAGAVTMMSDGVHPSPAGHADRALAVLRAIVT